jgi:hypothetical protein
MVSPSTCRQAATSFVAWAGQLSPPAVAGLAVTLLQFLPTTAQP